MRPTIELGHLKYFYYSVVEGGVGRAADRLHVQQPVVSKMIKSLEAQLGKPLFQKAGRKNTLTDFGQLVFRHSQSIFDEIEKLGQLEFNPRRLTGNLNIGASEPIAAGLLPQAIAQFHSESPEVNPNVYTATAAQLLEMLSTGKLDVGFFFHLPTLPGNLEIYQLIPTKFRLVVATTQKSSAEVLQSFIGSREVDDLSNQKFPTVELLRKSYPKTRIRYSSNHLGLHKALVLKGLGVSILPEFLVATELKSKKISDVFPKHKFEFDLKIVLRKGSPPSPLVASFLTKL